MDSSLRYALILSTFLSACASPVPGGGDRPREDGMDPDSPCAVDPASCDTPPVDCALEPGDPSCPPDDMPTPMGPVDPPPPAEPSEPGDPIDPEVPDPMEEACLPPDVLFVLDRTVSMASRPNGTRPGRNGPDQRAATKWFIAFRTLEAVVGSFDGMARFGVELFPRDPGRGACVTVGELLGGRGGATNEQCDVGELVLTPALGARVADEIGGDTRLCRSTPIRGAFSTATTVLDDLREPGRAQFVVLITDGGDSCDPDRRHLVVEAVDALAARGVRTIPVGFDRPGSGARGLMNDIACAGLMAIDFPTACEDIGGGRYRAVAGVTDPVYLNAFDALTLQGSLETVAARVGCGDDPGNPLPQPQD